MELTRLIKHPEELNKETLYDLRSLLALYPYYQTARLLLLKNLYVLHDPSFDEELRRAAIYITDRSIIFQMTEAAHYKLRTTPKPKTKEKPAGDRTSALIDNFLDSIPDEEKQDKQEKRRPTPADAAVDYVAYLLETESEEDKEAAEKTPQMKGQSLIDSFLEDGGFNLNFSDQEEDEKTVPVEMPVADYFNVSDDEEEDEDDYDLEEDEYPGLVPEEDIKEEEYQPEQEEENEEPVKNDDSNEGYFTETLARIYIKQGRYEKALEIIQRLNLNYPKKNAYFADQIRFLEKLIINNKNKK